MVCPFLEQNTHLRVLTGFSGAGRLLVEDFAMSLSLSYLLVKFGSEGRFVVATGKRSGRRGAPPWVVFGLLLWPRAAAVTTAATTAEAAASAATAAGFVHLGGGVLERRADLIALEFDDRALLALAGLVGPLLEPALDDHPRTAGEALAHVLGGLPPDAAPHEQRVAVLPLIALAVEDPRSGCDGEVGDSRP